MDFSNLGVTQLGDWAATLQDSTVADSPELSARQLKRYADLDDFGRLYPQSPQSVVIVKAVTGLTLNMSLRILKAMFDIGDQGVIHDWETLSNEAWLRVSDVAARRTLAGEGDLSVFISG